MAIDIRNQIVLITGANRGIGKTLVQTALEQGAAKVYAAVRDVTTVNELVEEYGDRVVAVAIDLQQPETIYAAAKSASDVHVVINNAGIARPNDVLTKDAFDQYDAEHRTNVLGWLHVAQAFAPVLKANGGGALVQLNSVASIKSFADFATYSASKAASYSLTQALREKLAGQQTAVVSVHPGPIKTDMADEVGLGDIAEPPSLVAESLFDALRNGDFHVFPDSMAKQFQAAYEGFAAAVVEGEAAEQA